MCSMVVRSEWLAAVLTAIAQRLPDDNSQTPFPNAVSGHGPERWVPAHKISCGKGFRYDCLLCGATLSVLEDQHKVTSTVPSQADNLAADLALPLAPMSKSPVSTNYLFSTSGKGC